MKLHILFVFLLLALMTLVVFGERPPARIRIPNEKINYDQFMRSVIEMEQLRSSRRLTEEGFLQAMGEPGVVILDARSSEKFRLRHIRGAVNLSLPDFTEGDLARIIPGKDTKVLIYCNNNFTGNATAFPSKAPGAALNLPTFAALHQYGYRNVYELGPRLNVGKAALPFAGVEVKTK